VFRQRQGPAIIVAAWPAQGERGRNWGDKLNPVLIHKLSGVPVTNAATTVGWKDRPVYRVIGSSLAAMRPNDVIWGMGLSNLTVEPEHRAAAIRAVRGPLTRARLLELGIPCPEVYGDPAILCPLFWRPQVEPTYDYGIVQHFAEADSLAVPRIAGSTSVRVIDIRDTIPGLIEAILSCRVIVSSSLHGIICAHAYGRPAYWLKMSDLPKGDDLKYRDYHASIGHPTIAPLALDAEGAVQLVGDPVTPVRGALDAQALLEACPFIDSSRRRWLLRRLGELKTEGHAGIIFDA
jgi:hypothetical protein